MPSDLDLLVDRRGHLTMFALLGMVCVIAGGIVAAVTGPTDFANGSWLAAFLVLVGGVAQWALGLGQVWLAPTEPSRGLIHAELATWNAGTALVILGTLIDVPVVTTLGGVVTLASLALFLSGVQGAQARHRKVLMAFRVLLVIELVSVPIGLTMSWLRT